MLSDDCHLSVLMAFVCVVPQWPWLITAFETLGGLTHLGGTLETLASALDQLFDELMRQQNRRCKKQKDIRADVDGVHGTNVAGAGPGEDHLDKVGGSKETDDQAEDAAASNDARHRFVIPTSFKNVLRRFDSSWVRSIQGQVEVGEDLYVMQLLLVECHLVSGARFSTPLLHLGCTCLHAQQSHLPHSHPTTGNIGTGLERTERFFGYRNEGTLTLAKSCDGLLKQLQELYIVWLTWMKQGRRSGGPGGVAAATASGKGGSTASFGFDNFGDAAFVRYHVHHGLRRMRHGQGYSAPLHSATCAAVGTAALNPPPTSSSASVVSAAASNRTSAMHRSSHRPPPPASAVRASLSSAPPRPPAAAFHRRATPTMLPADAISASASGVSTTANRPLRCERLVPAAIRVPTDAQPRDESNPNRLQTDLKNLSPEELDLLLKAARKNSNFLPAEQRP